MSIFRDFARALDPVAFAEQAGLAPQPWQMKMLQGAGQFAMFCCCRQSGKSTAAAARALHTALYEPGALVLVLSPTQRQSQELFLKIVEFYRRFDDLPSLAALSAMRLELPNGSRIVSLPGTGDKIRGYSNPRLVIIDEAAFCEDDDIAAAIPMMASGEGALIALSTPNGTRGWFHDAWHDQDFGAAAAVTWDRTMVTWRESGRVDERMVEFYRRLSGTIMAEQEFECRFIDVENTQLVPPSVFDAAMSDKVPVLWI